MEAPLPPVEQTEAPPVLEEQMPPIAGFVQLIMAPAPQLAPIIQAPPPPPQVVVIHPRRSNRLKKKPPTQLTSVQRAQAILQQKLEFMESAGSTKEEQYQQFIEMFKEPLSEEALKAVAELLEANAGR